MVLSNKFASDPIFFDNEANKKVLGQAITRSNNRFHVIDSNLQIELDQTLEAQFLNIAISNQEEVVFLTGTKVLSEDQTYHTLVNVLEICM